MKEETPECSNCMYFFGNRKRNEKGYFDWTDVSVCHRHAPVNHTQINKVFPRISADDWCGDYIKGNYKGV